MRFKYCSDSHRQVHEVMWILCRKEYIRGMQQGWEWFRIIIRISSRLQHTSINSKSDHHQLTSELHYSIHKNLILVQWKVIKKLWRSLTSILSWMHGLRSEVSVWVWVKLRSRMTKICYRLDRSIKEIKTNLSSRLRFTGLWHVQNSTGVATWTCRLQITATLLTERHVVVKDISNSCRKCSNRADH